MIKKAVESYARFVSKHPYIILFIVIIVSLLAFFGAKMVKMETMDYSDMLPDDIEVMQTMDVISDSFGGSSSAMVAVEIEPRYINSNEPRDIRDVEVISYVYTLSEALKHIDDVTGVSSAADILIQMNDGHLPKTKSMVEDALEKSPLLHSFISSNYELTLIRISMSDSYEEDELMVDIDKVLDEVPRPAGVKASLAGEELAMPMVKQQLGDDMGKTSRISMLGIIIILLLLFRSIRYSLTPLSTIVIGLLWAFGFIGAIGMSLDSATSGVISMIMGIGIDFGIQTVMRFRQELSRSAPSEAMNVTINAVFIPMATTTMSALIGFRAMSWGQLTMMAKMGTIMSYGITACFLAAVTVVPAILLIGERFSKKKIFKHANGGNNK